VGEYDIGGGGLQIGQILQETAGLKGQCHEICYFCFFMNQSLTPVANLPSVSLIPVVHLDLRISPRIFEKIRSGLNGTLWGWGETDS
jgi:hypothetical protein